jgi:hypothetical protein
MVPYTHIYRDSWYLKNLVKVVFVNDKVQAKDILDNMDVHNFAVYLFRQSGTG